MPITSSEIISSTPLAAGTHVFPARQITIAAGNRGLFLRVERNVNISPRWFRPGSVTWEVLPTAGGAIGITTTELIFDEDESYIPPSSIWGGQFRAVLRLREFIPLVTVVYGRLRDD